MRAYPEVIEEYLEELGFLWLQRRKLLFSPESGLRALRDHDARIAAHLDGLRDAGPDALPLALERLESDEPWEVFAGARAWLLAAAPDDSALRARLDAVPPELGPAWTEALRAAGRTVVGVPAGAAHVALVAAGPWCAPPQLAPAQDAAFSPSPALRRAAARALSAAPAGGPALARLALDQLFDDADRGVRCAAAWAAVLLDPARALPRLRTRTARDPDPFTLRVLGLTGDEADLAPVQEAARWGDPVLRAAAVRALGDLGFTAALPEILDGLAERGPVALAAADAYQTLTGIAVLAEREEHEEAADDAEEPADAPEPTIDLARAREAAPPPGHRLLRGTPLARGDDLERLWRREIRRPSAELHWLRREVPDGFFSAEPAPDARPGE